MTDVDLSQLAIDRPDRTKGGPRVGPDRHVGPGRHVVSRYVVPGVLLVGVATLVAWAAYDLVFPPREVTVVPVQTSQAEGRQEGTPLFEAAGWIEPRPTSVGVAALAPGVVEQLFVVEDQEVEAGKPIAKLVDADANLACQAAQADLRLREAEQRAAQATLHAATTRFEQPVHLEANVGEAEAELAVVETQLANLPFEIRRAEAALTYAKRNYEGKSSAGGSVAARVVDQAKSELASAQALAEELRKRGYSLTKQRTALGRRRDALQTQLELRIDERRAKDEAAANVDAAEARVQLAKVALTEAKLRLDRMTVRSPIDGRVLHLVAQPGSSLMVGQGRGGTYDASTVVTLYRPDMLQVRVDVRFEDLPKVLVGQPVSLSSPAVASPLAGKVLFVGSEADTQKNTLEVKVAIDAPPSVLKPEMLVDVTFLAPKSQDPQAVSSEELRLFVARKLVKEDSTGSFVWIADQSAGMARRAPVELGKATRDGFVEVTAGLNMASRLIASNDADLRDGERIRVTGEAPVEASSPATSLNPSR